MKKGDILRFSRFCESKCDPYLYAIVVDPDKDGECNIRLLFGGGEENADRIIRQDQDEEQWYTDDTQDYWQRLDERFVPSEVWAALATWRLSK